MTVPTNVTLELSNRTGGLTIDSVAGPVVKQTDANGEVSVSIQAGTLPTPYWVLATVNVGGVNRTTSSTLLTVSTGRPTQARFSLSAEYYNLEGLRYDSGATTSCNDVVCARVTVVAADTFGNPVPDGTVVNFISEGGTFDRPSCQTAAGVCTVVFRSANSRPADGRVTIVAYAVGEEDYDDANGNNRYDAGETFRELGWLYLDSNENLQRDALEAEVPFTGAASVGACVNGGVATFGVPSKPGTCDGVWGAAHVRRAAVFTFSDSFGVFKRSPGPPFGGSSDLASTTYPLGRLGDACVASVPFWLQDRNGNPLPYGTVLSAETFGATGAAAKIENAFIGSTTNPGGTFHVATVTVPFDTVNAVCPPAFVTIRATTTLNNASSVTVPIGQ